MQNQKDSKKVTLEKEALHLPWPGAYLKQTLVSANILEIDKKVTIPDGYFPGYLSRFQESFLIS